MVPVLLLRLAGLTDLQAPVFRLHPELLEIRLGPEGPEARLHLLVLRDLPDQEVLSLLVDQGPDRCIPTTSAP